MNKDLALKVLVWAIPVVFKAGTLYQIIVSDEGSIAALTDRVSEQEDGLDVHEKLAGHPVGLTEMQHLATQQDALLQEQRGTREEQQRQALSLVAICQATGAECAR